MVNCCIFGYNFIILASKIQDMQFRQHVFEIMHDLIMNNEGEKLVFLLRGISENRHLSFTPFGIRKILTFVRFHEVVKLCFLANKNVSGVVNITSSFVRENGTLGASGMCCEQPNTLI